MEIDDFVNFAMMQFQKRLARIKQAKGASLEEIYKVTQLAIDDNNA